MADEKNFTFVITPAKSTSPAQYIWKSPFVTKEGQPDPADQRLYTFANDLDVRWKDDFVVDPAYCRIDIYDEGCECYDVMERMLTDYAVPSVVTALGQAKRAVCKRTLSHDPRAKAKGPIVCARKRRCLGARASSAKSAEVEDEE